tara:strand:+ start:10291 stop:10791 length:501 start_codon:yes stop_codon:yes gene_type:complete
MIGFITGLPRSRTKWFADYFGGLVPSFHEPLNGMRSKNEFYNLVKSGCVISDSGLFLTDFQKRFSGVPTVIIERNAEDVFESLVDYFEDQEFPRPSWKVTLEHKAEIDKIKGLRIPFESINDRLEEIHELFNIPFSQDYADKMTVQNLQIPVLTTDVESFKVWRQI